MNKEKQQFGDLFKTAIDNGLTSVEEPIKFNMGTKELKQIIDEFGEDKNITVKLTKTGIVTKIEVSDKWDGEFTDFTDYSMI